MNQRILAAILLTLTLGMSIGVASAHHNTYTWYDDTYPRYYNDNIIHYNGYDSRYKHCDTSICYAYHPIIITNHGYSNLRTGSARNTYYRQHVYTNVRSHTYYSSPSGYRSQIYTFDYDPVLYPYSDPGYNRYY